MLFSLLPLVFGDLGQFWILNELELIELMPAERLLEVSYPSVELSHFFLDETIVHRVEIGAASEFTVEVGDVSGAPDSGLKCFDTFDSKLAQNDLNDVSAVLSKSEDTCSVKNHRELLVVRDDVVRWHHEVLHDVIHCGDAFLGEVVQD